MVSFDSYSIENNEKFNLFRPIVDEKWLCICYNLSEGRYSTKKLWFRSNSWHYFLFMYNIFRKFFHFSSQERYCPKYCLLQNLHKMLPSVGRRYVSRLALDCRYSFESCHELIAAFFYVWIVQFSSFTCVIDYASSACVPSTIHRIVDASLYDEIIATKNTSLSANIWVTRWTYDKQTRLRYYLAGHQAQSWQ